MSYSYLKSVIYFFLALILGSLNDVVLKHLCINNVQVCQAIFFRFLFGVLTMLPVVITYDRKALRTKFLAINVVKGCLLSIGMWLWGIGVKSIPLSIVSTIGFAMPLFVLLLSFVILKEHISAKLLGATLAGFIGIVLIMLPQKTHLNFHIILLLTAVLLFSALDILNKMYINSDPIITTMLYSTLTAALVIFLLSYHDWSHIPQNSFYGLLYLGIGNNALTYCLLKAFKGANASALAPFRYLEVFISTGLGYAFFGESPGMHIYVGAFIVAVSTFLIGYGQNQEQ